MDETDGDGKGGASAGVVRARQWVEPRSVPMAAERSVSPRHWVEGVMTGSEEHQIGSILLEIRTEARLNPGLSMLFAAAAS